MLMWKECGSLDPNCYHHVIKNILICCRDVIYGHDMMCDAIGSQCATAHTSFRLFDSIE